ncbi:hypothetical protein BH10ACI1_BH10ACI1_08520 [soil metagenome]
MILNQFILEKAVRQTFTDIPSGIGANLSKRHRNAINKAFERLIENPFISYENGKLLILSDSITETGDAKFYETSSKECRLIDPNNVLCHAFWEGFPCWHRATLAIVENYFRLVEESASKKTIPTVYIVNT